MPELTKPTDTRRPVAYMNENFLNSPDARAIRILSEFLEPLAHFRREKVRDTVVFSLTFDHRILDGALADQFMAKIKSALESWEEAVL